MIILVSVQPRQLDSSMYYQHPGRRHGAAAAGDPRAGAGLRVYSRHRARAGGGASCTSPASGRGPALQVQGIP